jgi:hypothetical protein
MHCNKEFSRVYLKDDSLVTVLIARYAVLEFLRNFDPLS